MAARFLAGTAALGLAAAIASPAASQQIYYEDGDYLFAVPAQPAAQDPVVGEPVETPRVTYDEDVAYETADTRVGAQRVIPARSAPQQYAPQRIILPAPEAGYAYPASAPVIYAAPVQGQPAYVVAARSIPAQRSAYTPAPQHYYGYASSAQQSGYLPGGGQLVAFDRNAWLDECSARLGTYEDSDRGRVLGDCSALPRAG